MAVVTQSGTIDGNTYLLTCLLNIHQVMQKLNILSVALWQAIPLYILVYSSFSRRKLEVWNLTATVVFLGGSSKNLLTCPDIVITHCDRKSANGFFSPTISKEKDMVLSASLENFFLAYCGFSGFYKKIRRGLT